MILHSLKLFCLLLFFLFSFIGLHYYPLHYLIELLAPEYTPYTYFVSILTVLTVLTGFMVGQLYKGVLFRIFFRLTLLWFGFVFFLFFMASLIHVITFFTPLQTTQQLLIILGMTVVISLSALYQGKKIHIKTIEIKTNKISKPYQIIHLSDLHLGLHATKEARRIVELIKPFQADLILITGDLLDSNTMAFEDIACFNELEAKQYFVFGNHELYLKKGVPEKILQDSKITLLRNETVDFEEIQIIGVDDYNRGLYPLKKTLKNISVKTDLYSILMSHQSAQIKVAASKNIDLMLCGHTHGGQIFPFHLFVRLSTPYLAGLFAYKNTKLHVSSGTSTWGPKMRLGSKNEIVVIKLAPA